MGKGVAGFVVATVLWFSVGCLIPHHRQHQLEKQWNSIWESWQEEVNDDCDYISSFKKDDCLKRHNKVL